MIIDVAYLAVQTAGDHDLERELLGLFAAQLDDAQTGLDHVADVRAAQGLLHRLRGSARAIGATGLGDRIERIERNVLEAGNLAPFLDDRNALRNLMREVSVCAASLIAARVPPGLAKRFENG